MAEDEVSREFTGHKDFLGQSIYVGDIICYQASKTPVRKKWTGVNTSSANAAQVTSKMQVARVKGFADKHVLLAFLTTTTSSLFTKDPLTILVVPKNEQLRDLPNEWVLELIYDLDSVKGDS